MKGFALAVAVLCWLPVFAQKPFPETALNRAAAKRFREVESCLKVTVKEKVESAAREER